MGLGVVKGDLVVVIANQMDLGVAKVVDLDLKIQTTLKEVVVVLEVEAGEEVEVLVGEEEVVLVGGEVAMEDLVVKWKMETVIVVVDLEVKEGLVALVAVDLAATDLQGMNISLFAYLSYVQF